MIEQGGRDEQTDSGDYIYRWYSKVNSRNDKITNNFETVGLLISNGL
jgi:hypothetical protein